MPRQWPRLTQEEKDAKIKRIVLPKHVQDMLDAQKAMHLPALSHFLPPLGLVTSKVLFETMDRKPHTNMWWRGFGHEDIDTETAASKSTEKVKTKRAKKESMKLPRTLSGESTPEKLDRIIAGNRFRKIAFVDLGCSDDILPGWVKERVKLACASMRFELPFDMRKLEKMSTLEYVANYIRLYRYQKVRYKAVFNRFKSPTDPYIECEDLFPALNSMFAGWLGKRNFVIVKTVLSLRTDEMYPLHAFIGICGYTDRLYWTYYQQKGIEEDTGESWQANRSALEAADMQNLKLKMEGHNLSKAMRALLFSLG